MKKLIVLGIILITVMCDIPTYAIVNNIVGSSVDATIPPPPTGVCLSEVFNLTDGGLIEVPLSTADSGGYSIFKAAPLENGSIGYGVAVGGVANIATLITFNLDTTPAIVTGSTVITTGSTPYIANAMRGNIYDEDRVSSGGFLIAQTRTTAPCTGGSVNCLNWTGYTDTTLTVDVTDLGTLTASGFNQLHKAVEQSPSTYWAAYTSTAGGTIIKKFNANLGAVASIASTPNGYGGITSDNTYVYATVNLAGTYNIRRIKISDLTITDFSLFAGNVYNNIYHFNGKLYVAGIEAGTGMLKRVDTATMAIDGTITLGVNEDIVLDGIKVDIANQKMYTSARSGNTNVQIRRINISSFTSEQLLSIDTGGAPGSGAQDKGTGFDFPHQHIWQAGISALGVFNRFRLYKINLCS